MTFTHHIPIIGPSLSYIAQISPLVWTVLVLLIALAGVYYRISAQFWYWYHGHEDVILYPISGRVSSAQAEHIGPTPAARSPPMEESPHTPINITIL